MNSAEWCYDNRGFIATKRCIVLSKGSLSDAFVKITLTVLETSYLGFADSADKDQTAQNVQSDL